MVKDTEGGQPTMVVPVKDFLMLKFYCKAFAAVIADRGCTMPRECRDLLAKYESGDDKRLKNP